MAFDVDRRFAPRLPVIADAPPLDQERNKGGGAHVLILFRDHQKHEKQGVLYDITIKILR